MSEQTATQGRIVLVASNTGASAEAGAGTAVAIVTAVHGHVNEEGNAPFDIVNVRVLADGPVSGDEWRTSVRLYADEETARKAGGHVAWWPRRAAPAAPAPRPAAPPK